jgi:hypothetical protein
LEEKILYIGLNDLTLYAEMRLLMTEASTVTSSGLNALYNNIAEIQVNGKEAHVTREIHN